MSALSGCKYSLFTLRKARSPLIINGERAFLRVNRLYMAGLLACLTQHHTLIESVLICEGI